MELGQPGAVLASSLIGTAERSDAAAEPYVAVPASLFGRIGELVPYFDLSCSYVRARERGGGLDTVGHLADQARQRGVVRGRRTE